SSSLTAWVSITWPRMFSADETLMENRMKLSYKWLIAAVAGAVAFFVWGAFSHMVLLKGVGFNRVSDEERIGSALRTSLPGDGLYFLPSIDLRGKPSAEETAAWEARFH